jgi:hypothetical protein
LVVTVLERLNVGHRNGSQYWPRPCHSDNRPEAERQRTQVRIHLVPVRDLFRG